MPVAVALAQQESGHSVVVVAAGQGAERPVTAVPVEIAVVVVAVVL